MNLHEFDSVALIVAIPADRLFPSELPEGEGLHGGDEGVIVDAMHAPAVYTVEFTRGGETVAIGDVRPEEIRLVRRHHPSDLARREDARASAI